jgi:hypothetical protein
VATAMRVACWEKDVICTKKTLILDVLLASWMTPHVSGTVFFGIYHFAFNPAPKWWFHDEQPNVI